jgi:hypothetical protein
VTEVVFRGIACVDCATYWAEGAEPTCLDASHAERYRRFETHRHRTPVELADGTVVTAVSFDEADPYTRTSTPDYGLYLDPRWAPPWPHHHLDWADFGVPDLTAARQALRALLERARTGEAVEVGCLGGHGRTGTALACLAVLSGHCVVRLKTDTQYG